VEYPEAKKVLSAPGRFAIRALEGFLLSRFFRAVPLL
jgi:hypothetical protein